MTHAIQTLRALALLLGPAGALCQISLEKERAMGAQQAKAILGESQVAGDAFVTAQIDWIAQAIAEACPSGRRIEVRVLVDSEPNASALPGGFLFVNTGLIRGADTESELAAVLAHLISRVQSDPMVTTRGNAGVGTIPLIYMGGRRGYEYRPSSSVLLPAAYLRHDRERVTAADASGARCLAEASYDPEGMLRSLEKIRKDEAATAPRVATSHPPAAERMQNVQTVLDTLPAKPDPVVTTNQFAELKSRVEMLYPPARQRIRAEREGPPTLRR